MGAPEGARDRPRLGGQGRCSEGQPVRRGDLATLRVLICGDRDWRDYALVKTVVATFPEDAVVIEGEARGADRQARIAARLRGLEVLAFPADWDHEGFAAGPLRNRRMLIEGRPDVVIWFHDHLPSSRGTRDMVEVARAAGVPTYSGVEWLRRAGGEV